MADLVQLNVQEVPYSSTVGGGLMLTDATGRARFIVMFMGTTEGITKEENGALASQIAKLIREHGLTVPRRPAAP